MARKGFGAAFRAFTDDKAAERAKNGGVGLWSVNGANGDSVDPLEQRVHLLYAALARRDLADLAAQLASEVVWEDARSHPFGSTYRGRVQVVDHLARLIGETQGSYQLTVLDLYASSAGRFVVRERENAWWRGRRLDQEVCLRVDVSPDGITHFERFHADLASTSPFLS
jgi:ketosteroid isomerase-like protein